MIDMKYNESLLASYMTNKQYSSLTCCVGDLDGPKVGHFETVGDIERVGEGVDTPSHRHWVGCCVGCKIILE